MEDLDQPVLGGGRDRLGRVSRPRAARSRPIRGVEREEFVAEEVEERLRREPQTVRQ
jgi:hypothetical protein